MVASISTVDEGNRNSLTTNAQMRLKMSSQLSRRNALQILAPMPTPMFERYLASAVTEYAGQDVISGGCSKTSVERLHRAYEKLLPQGVKTPDNYVFYIYAPEASSTVGALWMAVDGGAGTRSGFIDDVSISLQYRRRGYAARAFQALDMIARDLRLTTIKLHVLSNCMFLLTTPTLRHCMRHLVIDPSESICKTPCRSIVHSAGSYGSRGGRKWECNSTRYGFYEKREGACLESAGIVRRSRLNRESDISNNYFDEAEKQTLEQLAPNYQHRESRTRTPRLVLLTNGLKASKIVVRLGMSVQCPYDPVQVEPGRGVCDLLWRPGARRPRVPPATMYAMSVDVATTE
jgi:hypothetical protein